MHPFVSPRLSPVTKKEAMTVDDDYTLYSDGGSIYSRSNASTSSFVSFNAHDELPPFRLPKTDSSKEVYEAWTVYLSMEHDEPFFARKICGVTAVKEYDSYPGVVSSISELFDQGELMDMHLNSVEKYQAKHKRTWPSRLVRGAAASYEDDVDARIRKLPNPVQSEICRLLADREDASSNRFHNRAWTVVLMQEQLHRRFADASPKVVDRRHKVRFWKNPGKDERSEYFVVIRGREGRRIADATKGLCEFKRFENPWHLADEAEARRKTREELRKIREKRRATVPPPPSYRYSPPAPPPLPTFSRGSMYSAPGAYSRPHGGPTNVARSSSLPIPPGSRSSPYLEPYPQPPPAPTPPVSYPPPPPVQYMRGSGNCFGGPKYPASAPLVPSTTTYPLIYAPAPVPRARMFVPPPGHQTQPTQPTRPVRPGFTSPSGSSNSAPYTSTHCGGMTYNDNKDRAEGCFPAPPAPPAPRAPRPLSLPFGEGLSGAEVPPAMRPSSARSESYVNASDAGPSCRREPLGRDGVGKDIPDLSAREEESYEGHLCGAGNDDDDDDASETPSVRSWVWRTRDQKVDLGGASQEKAEADEDPERVAQQADLTRQMQELIKANQRRNEERQAAKLAEVEGADGSSVGSDGSGKAEGL